jgi:Family of unknown function (DUF6731)
MPIQVRADFFWFEPTSGTEEEVGRALAQYMNRRPPLFIEKSFGDADFRLANLAWSPQASRLSGVMYRRKETNLPSSLDNAGASPIPIDDDAALGVPICFCFYPRAKVAVVQFNQVGARHSTLRQFLPELGCSLMQTTPIFTLDMLERLENMRIVRTLEFTLRNGRTDQRLRNMGGGVGRAIDILSETEGNNISITVSMGTGQRREGLAEGVKNVVRRLVDDNTVVSTLKLRGKSDIDEEIDEIDLLHDRYQAYLEIDEIDRQLNTEDCVRRLHQAFLRRRDEFEQHSDR